MPINRQSLKQDGFTGIQGDRKTLEINRIPQRPGIFAVLRPEGYRAAVPGQEHGRDLQEKEPNTAGGRDRAEWVDAADVLYVGKAGPGSKGNRGLRRQIQEFVDFGRASRPAIGTAG